MAKQDNEAPQPLEVIAEPIKTVPKLVTKIGAAKDSTGNVILNLIFDMPGEKAQLVERVVIDSKTTQGLIDLLESLKEGGDE